VTRTTTTPDGDVFSSRARPRKVLARPRGRAQPGGDDAANSGNVATGRADPAPFVGMWRLQVTMAYHFAPISPEAAMTEVHHPPLPGSVRRSANHTDSVVAALKDDPGRKGLTVVDGAKGRVYRHTSVGRQLASRASRCPMSVKSSRAASGRNPGSASEATRAGRARAGRAAALFFYGHIFLHELARRTPVIGTGGSDGCYPAFAALAKSAPVFPNLRPPRPRTAPRNHLPPATRVGLSAARRSATTPAPRLGEASSRSGDAFRTDTTAARSGACRGSHCRGTRGP